MNSVTNLTVSSATYDSVFPWKIEKFSLQKGKLESSKIYSFNAEWCVEILLKDKSLGDDQIKIGFRQLTDFKVEANWSFAFLNSKYSLLTVREKNCVINNGKSCDACTCIVKYDEIFNASKISDDILVIVCRIRTIFIKYSSFNISKLKNSGQMWSLPRTDNKLQWILIRTDFKLTWNFPRTDFKRTSLLPGSDFEKFNLVIGKTFLWWYGNLVNLEPGEIVKFEEPILRNKVLTIKFYKETNERLIVIVETLTYTFLAKHKIYLRCENDYVELSEDKFKTDKSRYFFYLNFSYYYEVPPFAQLLFSCAFYDNRNEVSFANNSIQNFLPNRTPECSTNSSESVSEQPNTIIHKSQSRRSPQMRPSNTVSHDLRNMYKEGFLSDFNIRVQDRTFPVHKAILGARSSVFRVMFTADMTKKEGGHVNIPDTDADTVQRMLKFVYWDDVDKNMQWENACSLYSAADKYALESLKQICSFHLSVNLSVKSVLGVLLLSYTHQDQVLKSATLDFISKNHKEIIGTEMWSKFKMEHGPLSLEILQHLHLKKMDA